MSEKVLMEKLEKFISENLDELQQLGDEWIKKRVFNAIPEAMGEKAYTGHVMGEITLKLPFNWERRLPLPHLVLVSLAIKDGVGRYLKGLMYGKR